MRYLDAEKQLIDLICSLAAVNYTNSTEDTFSLTFGVCWDNEMSVLGESIRLGDSVMLFEELTVVQGDGHYFVEIWAAKVSLSRNPQLLTEKLKKVFKIFDERYAAKPVSIAPFSNIGDTQILDFMKYSYGSIFSEISIKKVV